MMKSSFSYTRLEMSYFLMTYSIMYAIATRLLFSLKGTYWQESMIETKFHVTFLLTECKIIRRTIHVDLKVVSFYPFKSS